MPIPRSVRRWLRLPGRAALVLGLGALTTAAARADMPGPSQSHPTALGDLVIRSEGGKIYLSEGGRDFQELQLSDTAEARHLKQLIEERGEAQGTPHLRLNPTILAGGGGSGFHWWGAADKTDNAGKTRASDQADTSKKPGSADKTNTNRTDKKE
jgi:hypothetical protein